MTLHSDVVTVNAPVTYRKFKVPNFATMHIALSQEGKELPSIPLSEISNEAFHMLVDAWVSEMYSKHNQQRPEKVVAA